MQIVAPNKNAGSKRFKLPAEGEHKAELESYEDLGLQFNHFKGKEEPRAKLVFKLDTGEKVFYWLTPSLHPMSKFFTVASALLGDNPSPDVLEVDDLVGLSCTVNIKHRTDKNNRTWAIITDVWSQ